MQRHSDHPSGEPHHYRSSWTHFSASEPSQKPVSALQSPPMLSSLTTTTQGISVVLRPTLSPWSPELISTSVSPSTKYHYPGSSSTVQISSGSFSVRASSLASPQTSITSVPGGKVFAAPISSISTLTVFDIITTSSPSPIYTVSTSVPTDPATTPNQQSGLFNKFSKVAKVGFLFGIILLSLFFIFLSIYLCTRQKRCQDLWHEYYPTTSSQRPISYAQEKRPLTSSTPEPYFGIEVIPAGVPKTSMDSAGVRWPEAVALVGDAKEVREWTEEYEKRRREECYGRSVLDTYGS